MDKKELYQKAEKTLNQAFEVTKEAVKVASEKAGEAAHITKIMIQKATAEHRISKKFAEIGHQVYEKSLQDKKTLSFDDSEVKELLAAAKALDAEISNLESTLEAEKKARVKVKK